MILLPPGIGDIYWTMCIMEDFLKVHSLDVPNVCIMSAPRKRDRSMDYVRMLPFVHAVGYHREEVWKSPIWNEVIKKGVLPNANGFEFFICLNGFLERGQRLEDVGYKVNYYPPMEFNQSDLDYGRNFRERIGPYVVAFITDHGMYQKWLRGMPPDQIYSVFRSIHEQFGYKVILTGASWDDNIVNRYLLSLDEGCDALVNMIGKTKLGEFFGLLKASGGCIGFCAGNTMMSVVFHVPTVMIWNKFFKEAFWRNACPPDSLNRWYRPIDSDLHSAEDVVKLFSECKDAV